jgi:hypothetical protein
MIFKTIYDILQCWILKLFIVCIFLIVLNWEIFFMLQQGYNRFWLRMLSIWYFLFIYSSPLKELIGGEKTNEYKNRILHIEYIEKYKNKT